jgi:hypothetical protein
MKKTKFKVRPMVLPEKKLFLLTNGKCGGTSLHRWFFMLLDEPLMSRGFYDLTKNFSLQFALKMMYIKRFKSEIINSNKDSDFRKFISLYRSTVCEKWLPKMHGNEFKKIWVVRDPVERCLSAYLDKFVGMDVSKKFVKDVIDFFPGQDGISFNQFIEYLELEDNDKCNGHWRRQSYIADHVGGDIKIIRLENFDDDVGNVLPKSSFLNFPSLPSRNVNEKFSDFAHLTRPAFKVDNNELIIFKRENGVLPPKSSFLEPGLVERIKKIYERDYELLPYT